jgi:hypothetical protein
VPAAKTAWNDVRFFRKYVASSKQILSQIWYAFTDTGLCLWYGAVETALRLRFSLKCAAFYFHVVALHLSLLICMRLLCSFCNWPLGYWLRTLIKENWTQLSRITTTIITSSDTFQKDLQFSHNGYLHRNTSSWESSPLTKRPGNIRQFCAVQLLRDILSASCSERPGLNSRLESFCPEKFTVVPNSSFRKMTG